MSKRTTSALPEQRVDPADLAHPAQVLVRDLAVEDRRHPPLVDFVGAGEGEDPRLRVLDRDRAAGDRRGRLGDLEEVVQFELLEFERRAGAAEVSRAERGAEHVVQFAPLDVLGHRQQRNLVLLGGAGQGLGPGASLAAGDRGEAADRQLRELRRQPLVGGQADREQQLTGDPGLRDRRQRVVEGDVGDLRVEAARGRDNFEELGPEVAAQATQFYPPESCAIDLGALLLLQHEQVTIVRFSARHKAGARLEGLPRGQPGRCSLHLERAYGRRAIASISNSRPGITRPATIVVRAGGGSANRAA